VIVRSPLVGLVSVVASTVLLTGCSNRLAFGTATKFGVDVSQRPDQTVEMTIGYDRAEVVVIPVPQDAKDATDTKDTYAVIGTFQVKHGNPFAGGALIIHQFFATGRAAIRAAQDPKFQEIFGTAAGDIYHQGRVDAK
jgi:hypothetical protein